MVIPSARAPTTSAVATMRVHSARAGSLAADPASATGQGEQGRGGVLCELPPEHPGEDGAAAQETRNAGDLSGARQQAAPVQARRGAGLGDELGVAAGHAHSDAAQQQDRAGHHHHRGERSNPGVPQQQELHPEDHSHDGCGPVRPIQSSPPRRPAPPDRGRDGRARRAAPGCGASSAGAARVRWPGPMPGPAGSDAQVVT